MLHSGRRVAQVIQSRPGALTEAQVEDAVARLQPLKVSPRDLLPNRARIERAHRRFAEAHGRPAAAGRGGPRRLRGGARLGRTRRDRDGRGAPRRGARARLRRRRGSAAPGRRRVVNPFEALGLAPTADRAAIRRAYAQGSASTAPTTTPPGSARSATRTKAALAAPRRRTRGPCRVLRRHRGPGGPCPRTPPTGPRPTPSRPKRAQADGIVMPAAWVERVREARALAAGPARDGALGGRAPRRRLRRRGRPGAVAAVAVARQCVARRSQRVARRGSAPTRASSRLRRAPTALTVGRPRRPRAGPAMGSAAHAGHRAGRRRADPRGRGCERHPSRRGRGHRRPRAAVGPGVGRPGVHARHARRAARAGPRGRGRARARRRGGDGRRGRDAAAARVDRGRRVRPHGADRGRGRASHLAGACSARRRPPPRAGRRAGAAPHRGALLARGAWGGGVGRAAQAPGRFWGSALWLLLVLGALGWRT